MAETITYPLTIDGISPSTVPMRRLAEYLAAYAALLGSAEHVRFGAVTDGSLVIRAIAPRERASEIDPRLISAAAGTGSMEVMRHFRRLNDLLGEDDTTAEIALSDGETVALVGRPERRPPLEVTDSASVQGRLIRLEGGGDPVGVGLEDEGRSVGRIFVPAALAVELGKLFRQSVRLTGEARWRRDEAGRWSLETMWATGFERLDDAPLSEVLDRAARHLGDDEAAAIVEAVRELRR